MGIKFILLKAGLFFTLIIAFFMLGNLTTFQTVIINEKNSDRLSLELAIKQDSVFYLSDQLALNFVISNHSIWPKKLNSNPDISTLIMGNEGVVYLKIQRDGLPYIYHNYEGKAPFPKYKLINKWRSISINYSIHFKDFFENTMSLDTMVFSKKAHTNTDFGLYKIQAFYSTSTATISSNIVKVAYSKSP